MKPLILLTAIAGLSLAALAADVSPDTPLISEGPLVVDAGDVEAYTLSIPPERRADFRTDYDRVAGVADGLFVRRTLAAKAKAAGLDQDPIVQRRLRQVQEAVLSDLYAEKLRAEPVKIDLEQRARELYKAEPDKFMTPELVHIESILVDLKGRTREMALARAKDVYERATTGKDDFLQLAARYSDDPSKNKNGGDLGYNSPKSFVDPVREAIDKMKKGEIVGPVESDYGFHVIKLVDRKEPERIPFDTVKRNLIKAEREKVEQKRVDDAVQAIRNSPTVVTNRDNVEKLVIKVDPNVIQRALKGEAQPAAAQGAK
jgi:hypothetical protein